jgi:UDPglucose 6-dehydrogenase
MIISIIIRIINSIDDFKNKSDIIVANRIDKILNDVARKVFTRDVYGNN